MPIHVVYIYCQCVLNFHMVIIPYREYKLDLLSGIIYIVRVSMYVRTNINSMYTYQGFM